METNASSRRTKQYFEILKPGVCRPRSPEPPVKFSENIMVFPMRPTRLNIFSSWFLIFWASEKGENDTNRSKTSLGIPWNRMRAKWDVLELETTSLHRGFAVAGKCICMAHRLSRRVREWGGELQRGFHINRHSGRQSWLYESRRLGVYSP